MYRQFCTECVLRREGENGSTSSTLSFELTKSLLQNENVSVTYMTFSEGGDLIALCGIPKGCRKERGKWGKGGGGGGAGTRDDGGGEKIEGDDDDGDDEKSGDSEDEGGIVYIYGTQSYSLLFTFFHRKQKILLIKFVDNGNILIVLSLDFLYLWNLNKKKPALDAQIRLPRNIFQFINTKKIRQYNDASSKCNDEEGSGGKEEYKERKLDEEEKERTEENNEQATGKRQEKNDGCIDEENKGSDKKTETISGNKNEEKTEEEEERRADREEQGKMEDKEEKEEKEKEEKEEKEKDDIDDIDIVGFDVLGIQKRKKILRYAKKPEGEGDSCDNQEVYTDSEDSSFCDEKEEEEEQEEEKGRKEDEEGKEARRTTEYEIVGISYILGVGKKPPMYIRAKKIYSFNENNEKTRDKVYSDVSSLKGEGRKNDDESICDIHMDDEGMSDNLIIQKITPESSPKKHDEGKEEEEEEKRKKVYNNVEEVETTRQEEEDQNESTHRLLMKRKYQSKNEKTYFNVEENIASFEKIVNSASVNESYKNHVNDELSEEGRNTEEKQGKKIKENTNNEDEEEKCDEEEKEVDIKFNVIQEGSDTCNYSGGGEAGEGEWVTKCEILLPKEYEKEFEKYKEYDCTFPFCAFLRKQFYTFGRLRKKMVTKDGKKSNNYCIFNEEEDGRESCLSAKKIISNPFKWKNNKKFVSKQLAHSENKKDYSNDSLFHSRKSRCMYTENKNNNSICGSHINIDCGYNGSKNTRHGCDAVLNDAHEVDEANKINAAQANYANNLNNNNGKNVSKSNGENDNTHCDFERNHGDDTSNDHMRERRSNNDDPTNNNNYSSSNNNFFTSNSIVTTIAVDHGSSGFPFASSSSPPLLPFPSSISPPNSCLSNSVFSSSVCCSSSSYSASTNNLTQWLVGVCLLKTIFVIMNTKRETLAKINTEHHAAGFSSSHPLEIRIRHDLTFVAIRCVDSLTILKLNIHKTKKKETFPNKNRQNMLMKKTQKASFRKQKHSVEEECKHFGGGEVNKNLIESAGEKYMNNENQIESKNNMSTNNKKDSDNASYICTGNSSIRGGNTKHIYAENDNDSSAISHEELHIKLSLQYIYFDAVQKENYNCCFFTEYPNFNFVGLSADRLGFAYVYIFDLFADSALLGLKYKIDATKFCGFSQLSWCPGESYFGGIVKREKFVVFFENEKTSPWVGLVPGFECIERNREVVEYEDEFDKVDEFLLELQTKNYINKIRTNFDRGNRVYLPVADEDFVSEWFYSPFYKQPPNYKFYDIGYFLFEDEWRECMKKQKVIKKEEQKSTRSLLNDEEYAKEYFNINSSETNHKIFPKATAYNTSLEKGGKICCQNAKIFAYYQKMLSG